MAVLTLRDSYWNDFAIKLTIECIFNGKVINCPKNDNGSKMKTWLFMSYMPANIANSLEIYASSAKI